MVKTTNKNLSERLTLKSKLASEKNKLEKLKKERDAFVEFDKKYPHPNNNAEFIAMDSKILKVQSKILLLDSQLWALEHPEQQNQPQ